MKKSVKWLLMLTGIFSFGAAQADVASNLEAFKEADKLKAPAHLPLPKNIKIVSNLAFGGRAYLYHDDSSSHFPPDPTLSLISPYRGRVEADPQNALHVSLKQSVGKNLCRKGLPYRLAIEGYIEISDQEFRKHAHCLPSLARLWFDNGESIALNSDNVGCYTKKNGKFIDEDYFRVRLDTYSDSAEDTDDENINLKESLQSQENEHQAALLFQKHLPIAISYGDYALSFTYPDPAPLKEFQKQLNDPQRLQESITSTENGAKNWGCG